MTCEGQADSPDRRNPSQHRNPLVPRPILTWVNLIWRDCKVEMAVSVTRPTKLKGEKDSGGSPLSCPFFLCKDPNAWGEVEEFRPHKLLWRCWRGIFRFLAFIFIFEAEGPVFDIFVNHLCSCQQFHYIPFFSWNGSVAPEMYEILMSWLPGPRPKWNWNWILNQNGFISLAVLGNYMEVSGIKKRKFCTKGCIWSHL